MKRIALTGGIATGKSYVLKQFQALGVPTIDADALAKEAVEPGTEGFRAVVSAFGDEIVDAHGALDRRRLGAVVFADPGRRRVLEQILHPEVRRRMDAWFEGLDGRQPFAIFDIPLLYETGRETEFESVIVAAVDPDTQIRRVMERNGLSRAEAEQRLAAQLPIVSKEQRADFVIRTDGAFADTDRQVEDVFHALTAATDD